MAGGRDKTPDKVLEKEERAEGVRALGEEERTDNEQRVDADEKVHFESIAVAMSKAVADKPSLELHEDMSVEEQRAIELLYEAASGQEVQSGDYLFADQRSALLNQALRTLQPVLALGLAPDFVEGRAAYAKLAEDVSGLRQELEKAAVGQLPLNVKRKPKDAAEADDDDDAADDDAADDDGAADVVDDQGEQSKTDRDAAPIWEPPEAADREPEKSP